MRRARVAIAAAAALTFLLGIAAVWSGGDDGDDAPGPARPGGGGAAAPTTTPSSAPPAPPVPDTPPDRGVLTAGPDGVTLHDTPGGAQTGTIRSGVLLPYTERREGWARVLTPCENRAWARLDAGVARGPVKVVVDPGHGGDEPGAVGPSGLTEAEVNLDVSRRLVDLLLARGIDAVLTRSDDYRATLAFRVDLAVAAGAEAFVSVHHNAEPDEQRETPGNEAYFQFRSEESKRLTGLVQEEVFLAFSTYDISFAADFDAGAKWRLGDSGNDYYGILRRTFEAEIPAVLAESAFISNPEEESLLARDDVRQAEAEAIARAVERFFAGGEPGDVFTEPYPRTTPAGGGGGQQGCVDPA